MTLRIATAGLVVIATQFSTASFAQVAPAINHVDVVADDFQAAHPGTGMLRVGDQLARVHGTFSNGQTRSSP